MKLGLALPQLDPDIKPLTVREFAIGAERRGFDSLWVQDHVLFPLQPLDARPSAAVTAWPEQYRYVMSPLELLSFAAAVTQRVRLGTSILVTAFHRPVMLAKQTATLDQLSNGRVTIGLGAGWSQEEFQVMETPFAKRGERTSDFIRAMRACWGSNPVEYKGPYFQIPYCETSPKPVQRDAQGRPHIPLMGGFLAAVGFDRTAELCDIWHPSALFADDIRKFKAEVDKIAAERYGRPPLGLVARAFVAPKMPGVGKITIPPVPPQFVGTVDEIIAGVRSMKDIGVDELIFDTNYFMENNGDEGWLAQLDFLEPVLDYCHAA